jgi:hypothetical protein
MAGIHVIHVPLPESAEPTREDIELLQGIFDAIVSLRFGRGRAGDEVLQALGADGWRVRTWLGWVAEARKGGECEQVTGASKGEALVHLEQLVRADRVISAL